jgi:uncharacterized protein YhbP (UPF0306 family)
MISSDLVVSGGASASVEDVRASIQAIYDGVSLCSVAVVEAQSPWIATMYFAPVHLSKLIVLTPPATRHAQAWHDAGAAVAIYASDQPFEERKHGLQALASVRELAPSECASALDAYRRRFPGTSTWLRSVDDLQSIESRFFVLQISEAKLFDERRFGVEVWLTIEFPSNGSLAASASGGVTT